MLKIFILTSLLFTRALTEDIYDPEFDYANMDTSDYEKTVDQYFGDRKGTISTLEALDVLLLTYAETNNKEIAEIETKSQTGEELDDLEEEKIFLKVHLHNFFVEKYKDQEITVDKLKDIINKNEVLLYLEEKMKEEDYRAFNETGDEELEDDISDYDDDEMYNTTDDLEDELIDEGSFGEDDLGTDEM